MRTFGLAILSCCWLDAAAAEVPPAYRTVADQHGIPARLFYAIALTESARHISGGQTAAPWPWTLNIQGSGYYYPDRRSAWRELMRSLAADRRSVDIGPMQVSWRYHHTRLGNAWGALDPVRNLEVAAEILLGCQARLDDWWDSVGCYHAPNNPQRAAAYRQRVRAHWLRIE